jgi:hypothetical protein
MHSRLLRIADRTRRTRLSHALGSMKRPFNLGTFLYNFARRIRTLRHRPRTKIHVSEKMKKPFPAWTVLMVLLVGAGLGYFTPIFVGQFTGAGPSSNPDFNMGLSPPTSTVPQGSYTAITVSMNSLNGFAGSVNLNASTTPNIDSSSIGLNPSSSSLFTGNAYATLTVTVPSNTPVGTYSLKVTGTSGQISHSANSILQVTVPPSPNYQLTASPSSINITRGSTDTSTITLTSIGGFSGMVNMSATISPSGANTPTLSLNPVRVTLLSGGTANVVLTLATTGTTNRGNYNVIVQGKSGTLSNTVSITVLVQ